MSETARRSCPSCGSALQPVHHEGVELDRCPAGHGIWLDAGELRAVVMSEREDRSEPEERAAMARAARDGGRALVAELERAPRACPVCAGAMQVIEYAASGIAIDDCASHGVWLDDGELEGIEAYAEGFRAVARPGAVAGGAGMLVAGIDVPASLLATIRTAQAPPSQ